VEFEKILADNNYKEKGGMDEQEYRPEPSAQLRLIGV